MLPSNIESEVKNILVKNGKSGWLRTGKCEEEYLKLFQSQSEKNTAHVRFYRFTKDIQKKKHEGFQVLKFPGNISYIGLEAANPTILKELEEKPSIDKKSAYVDVLLGYFKDIIELHKKGEEELANKNLLKLQNMIPEWLKTEEYNKAVEAAKEIEKIDERREWCGKRVGPPRYREQVVFNIPKLLNAISNLLANLEKREEAR